MGYQFVKPTEEQVETMNELRDRFQELHAHIADVVEDSRGRSVCFTKLEEASFWLNKSITKND